jgi:hypothetical protein
MTAELSWAARAAYKAAMMRRNEVAAFAAAVAVVRRELPISELLVRRFVAEALASHPLTWPHPARAHRSSPAAALPGRASSPESIGSRSDGPGFPSRRRPPAR